MTQPKYKITGDVRKEVAEYVAERALDNPFNYNYLFSEKDLKRANLDIWTRFGLLLRPMLIQIQEGRVYHFKVGSRGEIYFFYAENLPEL